MKEEYVKEIPPRETRRGYHSWIDTLERFQKSDERIVKITATENDYKKPQYMVNAAREAIKRHVKGGMDVTRRGWDLYIFKTI